MATYLAVVAAGYYERVDSVSPQGIPIRHYLFPERVAEHAVADADTGAALDWMGSLFGTYPFEVYGHVTADVGNVSLETQSMVLLSSTLIGTRTIAHEMAICGLAIGSVSTPGGRCGAMRALLPMYKSCGRRATIQRRWNL